MATISRNAGSAPLTGSKVLQDRGSDGSIRREKGSSDPRSDAKSDANCVQFEADLMPNGVKIMAPKQ